ncbi:MAG: DUF3367 domain-containing protein [Actinobacteria bacterium]|uniref:Unannotated protein n=1 Tax=freshwater metagenome TaxID=449393 RepID=A0A6J7DHL5_9ZZZZ|nr:DUF3367 domain-containing protein [Actinomycetota bacterium]
MSTTPRTGDEETTETGVEEQSQVATPVPAGLEPLLDSSTTETVDLVEIGEIQAPVTAPVPTVEEVLTKPRTPLLPKRAEWLLLLASAVMTFLQRPGLVFTDSRSDLTADPTLFLSRVSDVWSSTYDLGHVQSGQFVGYLFPMAPFYAGGSELGIPMWMVQRLWLTMILAGGAIGISRLLGALWDRHDGTARLLAGLVFVFNPYVVTQINRGTITLLAYAVLPWLLLAAHRGVLQPRRWRWPITAGMLIAVGGGGVNAAVLLWVLLAPLLLMFYEVAVIGRSRKAAWSFLWRTMLCVAGLSIWWAIPVWLQSGYGADFLSFTEQPSTIWATNSVSESLRLLGYWISYFQIGFGASRAVVPPTTVYLFAPVLVAATFAVPLMAFGSLSRIWKRPYIPFFVLLAVFSTTVMAVGFPPGKPLYTLLIKAYYGFPLLQILRTTYKAAPLLSVALACLVGAGGADLLRRARTPASRRAMTAGLIAIPIAFGWPMFTGHAIDAQLAYKDVPDYWRAAASDLNTKTAPGYRAMILPGQQFGVYRWGATFDPVAPAITKAPVAQRYAVRYSDAHSSQLLTAVDNLVQQRRLIPGQLGRLLRLIGVDQVIVSADGTPESSGEIDAASAVQAFKTEPYLNKPAESYGPNILVPPAVGRGGPVVSLPAIRRYKITGTEANSPGLIRAHSRKSSVLVTGDANAITELAAANLMPDSKAILFTGDQSQAQLKSLVHDGASLVITDTNRRQTVLATRTTHDQGTVLSTRDKIAPDVPSYALFEGIGHSKQTVSVYTGVDYVTNPEGPQLLLRPEARPYAAMDGDLRTTWTPSNFLPASRWIEVGLKKPVQVEAIQIHPHRDGLVQTTRIALSVNGGPERDIKLMPGWNSVGMGAIPISTIRVRITHTSTFGGIDLGGIDEIKIPRVSVHEWLRTPIWASKATAGMNLSRNPISVLLSRQTAPDPYRESGAYGGPVPTGDPQATFDAERSIERIVSIPTSRNFLPAGWASSAPWAADPKFDRLVGMKGGWTFSGSPRFEGQPIHRASSAFDHNPRTAWIGESRTGIKPWLAWRAPKPVLVRSLKLVPDSPLYARATLVKVTFDGLATGLVKVGANGSVSLPRAIRARNIRIDIVKSAVPPGPASFRLLPAVAIREVVVPGMKAPAPRRRGTFATACGSLRVNANDSSVKGRVTGTVDDLDNARPLKFSSCGARKTIPLIGGPNAIIAPEGTLMRIDHLELTAKPPKPAVAQTGARALSPHLDKDGYAHVQFDGPGWLVRGESMSVGWKAFCGPDRDHMVDLGVPRVVDGFAAGWPVSSKCRVARFSFAPQATATNAYIASAGATGLFALILSASLLATRRRRLAGAPEPIETTPHDAPGNDPLAHARRGFAATAPLFAGALAAALFALRVAPPIALLTLFLGLWGVNVRRLYTMAFVALCLVPLGYLAQLPKNKNGGNFYYAVELIGEHWISTVAILLAGSGAFLTALRIRWATHPRAGRWSIRRIRATVRLKKFRRRGASG